MMSIWNDKEITNWVTGLSDEDTQFTTIIVSDKSDIDITPTIPSLKDSTSFSEPEEPTTRSQKRTQHTQQEPLRGEPPQKKLRRRSRSRVRTEQPSSSSLEEQYFEPQTSELEAPQMVQDTASVSGSSVSALSTRPILEAKPPSRRSSRPPSPVRSVLALLRSATPPVDICQPGPAATATPSDAVEQLKSFLLDGYDKAFIPKELETRLRVNAPDEAVVLNETMFHDDHGYTVDELDILWGNVKEIYHEANACSNLLKDENAWVQVVRSVLRMTGTHALSRDLELNSVQSQSIDSQYLPILPMSATSLSKRADLALVISPTVRDSEIDLWRKQNPGVGLSHMTDAYTREMMLVCPIEVKRQGGDYNEAVCQLAVWSAAALAKLRSLARMGRDEEMVEGFPYPGWTVVGYEWQLHISWKENSGKVTVFGPFPLFSVKMSSYLDIFRLERLLTRLEKWFMQDYMSWACGHVLGPR